MRNTLISAAFIGMSFAATANAATITTTGGTATCYEAGSMTVMAACSGYVFGPGGANDVPGIISATLGDVWGIGAVTGSNAQSEANEAVLLNNITGTTAFVVGDMSRTGGNSGSMTFLLDRLYAVIKIGAGHVILRNDANTSISVAWAAASGAGGGLSHYTLAGDIPPPNPIPLPAAAWLLLSGMGGLGVMGWRKRRQVA